MASLRFGVVMAVAAAFLMLTGPVLSELGWMTVDQAYAAKKKRKKSSSSEEDSSSSSETAAPANPTKPDLVLVKDLTEVKFGGCNLGDPLVTGAMVFRNIGTRSNLKITKPLVAAYIPENLDMTDANTVLNSLDTLEVTSKSITIGQGLVKAGRGFKGVRKVYIVIDPYNIVDEGNEQNNIIIRDVRMSCD